MEISSIGTYKCSSSECSIETTGKCVNGLPIGDCANKIPIFKSDENSENEIRAEPIAKPTTRKLPWGDIFEDGTLKDITFRFPAKMILVVGEPKTGKSTLYAAIMDKFHKGESEKYFFHSTRTPIGFERTCHLARIKSKGETPDTERTKSYQFSYYHLSIREKSLTKKAQHLLFADVNGERFQDAKNSDEEVKRLTILKLCDHIFFMADGSKLINDEAKHTAKQDIWRIIDRCRQNKMLPLNRKIHLLIAKWDKITLANKTEEVENFFITPTQNRYKDIIDQTVLVASRSMNKDVPSRTGIDQILDICMSTTPSQEIDTDITQVLTRQFQKFKYRPAL